MTFVLDMFSVYDKSRATRKAAREEELLANDEAAQLEQRAAQTLAAGSYNSDRIKTRAAEIISEARAKAAANGGDTTSGSALEIRKKSIRESSLDQLLVMKDSMDDAAKDKKQAQVTRQTGKRQAGRLNHEAAAGVVSGVSSLAKRATETIATGGADWKVLFS